MRKRYETRTQKLGVVQQMIFTDGIRREDLPPIPLLNTESFRIVLAEALTCNTPIIASNLTSVRTVIDEETGMLIKPRSYMDIVHTVRAALKNKHRHRRISKKAHRFYTPITVSKKCECVYKEMPHE